MRKATTFLVSVVLMLGLVGISKAQQTGTLTGRVTDTDDQPLSGANVVLRGTQLGTATGPDGTYRITGIEPGQYTIVVSFVGFRRQTASGIQISAGQTV